jgi:hypothetical protein
MVLQPVDIDGKLLQKGDYVTATDKFDHKMTGFKGVVEHVREDGLVSVRLEKPLQMSNSCELVVSAAFLWRLKARSEGTS